MVRRKRSPRRVFDFLYKAFLVLVTIFAFWFELLVVLPVLHPHTSLRYVFHVFLATFLSINTIHNYVYLATTDTIDRGAAGSAVFDRKSGRLCSVCEVFIPPILWHCAICHICDVREDHHRQFASCCVGYNNYRYFFHFLVCFAFSTVHTLLINTHFLFLTRDFDLLAEYWFPPCYALNLLGVLFSLLLLREHGSSVVTGLVKCPTHRVFDHDLASVEMNLVQALGRRWYLTWISPMVHSQLPTIRGRTHECWSYDSDQ